MIKIYGARPSTSVASLCAMCRAAMVVKGTNISDDITICQRGLGRVTFVVTECNKYDDAGRADVNDEVAWYWMDELHRFVSPAERHGLVRPTTRSIPE